MPTLPIRQLGMTGLQRDVNAFDVPASGLITARNVRIKDRAITALSDASPVIETLETENLLFADGIFRDRDLLSGVIVVLADELAGAFGAGFDAAFDIEGQIRIYFYDVEGNRTEIGPTVPFTPETEDWFGTRAGEYYHLTNSSRQDVPHTWLVNQLILPLMLPMLGWPGNYRCEFLVSHRNYLVAGGITKDGDYIPELVKWSHPVSPGDIEFFWDFTDPTILAGENPILDASREMTGLHPFRDLLMVYFDRSVWRMSLVGGQQVFSFERAFTDDGAISSRSMVEVNGLAYVFGHNDIYTHDGFVKQSISDLRVTRYFRNAIDPGERIDSVYYPVNNEVIWLGRSPGIQSSIDGDLLFIYNIPNDGWTDADIRLNNDGSLALLFTGPNIIVGTAEEAWDTIPGTWVTQGSFTWAGAFRSPDAETLYGMSLQNSAIYDLDAASGESVFREGAVISHTKIDLDELGESVGDRVLYINRIYPQISGTGVVEFKFGASATPNSPVNFTETCLFKIAKVDVNNPDEAPADYACDVRISGRYLAYEMRPIANAFFSISGFDLEVLKVGEQ